MITDEINMELLDEVKKSAPYVVAALVVVGAFYGVKNYLAARKVAASAAITNSFTAEEMEEAVAKYGSTDSGSTLKLMLAKKYYDSERYEEALEQYEGLIGKVDAAFADIPLVGKAQTLEALGKIDEAMSAYDDFAKTNPNSFLALSAQLGVVRCVATKDKEDALKRLGELKELVKDDPAKTARVEALTDVITRK